MRFCELREKEVINTCSGKRLGFITDFIFNSYYNSIESFIIPGPAKFFNLFGTDTEYIIPFECIKKIGEDIIIVEINEEKYLYERH